uniref:GTP cyclohydrolase II n=1 Tax=Cyanoptyche gloeocystis TaxID=77922 RepID=A0A126WYY6_9EUKA|nr:putative LOV domain-containing protein [Cyanoptyche gloeocystis]
MVQVVSSEPMTSKAAQNFLRGRGSREGVVVTNAREIIIYVSDEFSRLTGYSRHEIIGRNCRFLQGSDTDPEAVSEIRQAIRERRECRVGLLNYRKDGSQFWNLLSITPIRNRRGQVTSFAGALMMMALVPTPFTDSQLFASSFPLTETETPIDAEILSEHFFFPRKRVTAKLLAVIPRTDFVAETILPTSKGPFRLRAYRDRHIPGYEPVALISGHVEGMKDVILRVHDQCVTSEVFGSLKCDCKDQLDYSMEFIRDQGAGLVIYLQQEGRGIGLANKIAAYRMQELGYDTVDANRVLGLPDDSRDYHAVKDILDELNIQSVRLLTNNPRKIDRLTSLGACVSSRIPIVLPTNEFSAGYLSAKAARMGHILETRTMVVTEHSHGSRECGSLL